MRAYRVIYLLAVVSFGLTNFPVFGSIGTLSRVLALLLLALMLIGATSSQHSPLLGLVIGVFGVFGLWCLTTVFWSENYWLSLVKLAAYSLTVIGLLVGGSFLGRNSGDDANPFWPLAFLFVPTVVSSMIVLVRGGGYVGHNFRGLTGNSNTLGASLVLTSPWLIFEFLRGVKTRAKKLIFYPLALMTVCLVLLSYSRASMLAGLVLILVSILLQGASKKIKYVYLGVTMVLLISIVSPQIFDKVYTQMLLKRSESFTASRAEQMQSTMEAAKKGGFFGVGFGVSAGESRYWNFGTFSSASREKGNSQLAIVEETGIVGFVFYLIFLGGIGTGFWKLIWSASGVSQKIAVLGAGFFVAAILHSAFEAWFFSIGPETAFFWTTIGITFGYCSKKQAELASSRRGLKIATTPSAAAAGR